MTRPELDLLNCPLDGIGLIEASAGTGKTWNICGLVLRLLLERGLELPQILVVTFTNAATAELRERVRARLAQTLAVLQGGAPPPSDAFVPALLRSLRERHGLDEAVLAQRLALALQCFDEAAIFTIHGFCQRALADVPFAAGMPLALAPLPDDSALLLQAVHEFWRRHVASDDLDPALAAYLAACRDTPEKYAALLARRLRKPLSPLRWPADLDAAEDTGADAGAALAEAFAAARACWTDERDTIAETLRGALPALHAGSYGPRAVAQALVAWQRWFQAGDALAPLGADTERLALLSAATLARRTRKAAADGTPAHRFFALAEALLAARRAVEGSLRRARLRLLRRLFDEAGAALRQRKRELRVAAFDDMLFNLHERLQAAPALADTLRQRYPAALIDEFQDTDPLQWAIVERIWGDGTSPLLLVGDPRQAIYSFRNADLPTYLRARQRASAVYTLTRNQRAAPALVSALDALFQVHPRSFLLPGLESVPAGLGERPRPAFVDESPDEAQGAGALRLWLLPRDEAGRPLPREAALDASVRATAAEIARLLREARAGRVRLDGRPLQGSDVAVLVRSHAQAARVRQALSALGVGSVALSRASVLHMPVARELQRVLAAVLEPAHGGLLRAALATELMGFDAAAIDALDRDDAALAAWQERFTDWHACWHGQGVAALLRRWQREAGVAPRLLARADGARRFTDLRHLGEVLHEAAPLQPSPRALLRSFELRCARPGDDEGAQLRLESDRQLVRVVTIHQAKGLEYGLAFCPLLWDAAAAPAAAPGLYEYHDAQGQPVLELPAGDDAGGAQSSGAEDGPDAAAIRRQVRLEHAAETLRLAYVALTRAVHRCWLVVGPWAARNGKGLSPQAGGRSLLNWLVAGGDYAADPARWFEQPPGPDAVEAAWRRLAAGSRAISLAPLPMQPGEPLAPAPARRVEVPAPPPRIAPGWRLVEAAADAWAPEPDTDEGARADTPLAHAPDDAAALPRDDVLRFPTGPLAEQALRAALLNADFADPDSWEAAARDALRAHPLPGAGGEAGERAHAAQLRRMLADVLSTEIAPGLRLRDLAPGRGIKGLEFCLPAPGLPAFQDHFPVRPEPVEGLSLNGISSRQGSNEPEPDDGYVHGVIDLVFEHGGRWWLLDWSAQRLGTRAADYAGAALALAAQDHEPRLRLATLALERWLRRRVPGWCPDTHLGGALLLFARGVRPHWRDGRGQPCGVVWVRPAPGDPGRPAESPRPGCE
ncbi:UvrD-helicase domain-containing protein [Azohydromonas aeria]|uniref:UvrD-helicase domain-containing protein n=1 Tax=Azohydromonas aeria TaxID=2590212 RepID=UPI001E43FBBA|nr:UvrD-helicase domain-containing protein [Azohydromonas aeria]